ncbi:hypothetical protein LRR18_05885 [Mangrovimonas sp. AS39]|uniref:hypothetical protein n=1 Tax=Mangrovimonas futianensis TaxID=2895523 RepID=UPI001E3E3DE1|nr:hypothetical protein [Mangrovimonas futianensis]MCF1191109.1 hypothetical protein [Mangrovimonas futianensis]MCF1194804.1 hypothetical protein [Mangrovimonas futianensis]
MKHITGFFTIAVLFASCGTYNNDYEIVQNSSEKVVEIEAHDDYDRLNYINDFISSAGHVDFQPLHYTVTIPKGSKKIYIITNCVYLDYGNKEFIVIDGGFKGRKSTDSEFQLADIDVLELERKLSSYLNDRGYNKSIIYRAKKNRITKIYQNESARILLFNIHKSNFEFYLKCLQSFEYYDNTHR